MSSHADRTTDASQAFGSFAGFNPVAVETPPPRWALRRQVRPAAPSDLQSYVCVVVGMLAYVALLPIWIEWQSSNRTSLMGASVAAEVATGVMLVLIVGFPLLLLVAATVHICRRHVLGATSSPLVPPAVAGIAAVAMALPAWGRLGDRKILQGIRDAFTADCGCTVVNAADWDGAGRLTPIAAPPASTPKRPTPPLPWPTDTVAAVRNFLMLPVALTLVCQGFAFVPWIGKPRRRLAWSARWTLRQIAGAVGIVAAGLTCWRLAGPHDPLLLVGLACWAPFYMFGICVFATAWNLGTAKEKCPQPYR